MRHPVASSKTKQAAEEQAELLERLKAIAAGIGLDVREEVLRSGAGYSVRSGLCRVKGQDTVMLDRNLPAGDRAEVLAAALATMDLEAVYMEPELRRIILGPASDDDPERADSV